MPIEEKDLRIAVIVPKHRAWHWHDHAVAILQKRFQVDVYTSASSPPYPIFLRILLRLEQHLFGAFSLAKLTTIAAPPWSQAPKNIYTIAINLSECPIDFDRPVVEPRFGAHADSLNLVAILLVRKNPQISLHLSNPSEPITASYLAIQDRTVLSRGLEASFSRLSVLVLRSVCHFIDGTRAATLPSAGGGQIRYSAMLIWQFCANLFFNKSIGRALRMFWLPEHWSVGILDASDWNSIERLPVQNIFTINDDRNRFYADPFLFSQGDQTWLFVEDYDYKARSGIISCCKLTKNTAVDLPRPALTRPYHLSYPFVFRHNEIIFMISETGNNRTVELYQARSFPFEWVLKRVLLENIEIYDATLLLYKKIWWLFGAIVHDGGSTQDELAIFHSPAIEGPWTPHKLNPVKSDCRSARPAGHILLCNGRLLRPAQDCETTYGSGIRWFEIEELSEETYRERELLRWPGTMLQADGIHTFNRLDRFAVVDFRRRMWIWE